MQDVKDLNNNDEKRLKLKARQNMKLNETLSNYLKIRTAQQENSHTPRIPENDDKNVEM